MTGRLSAAGVASLPPGIGTPAYDREHLQCGIVHLGLGAFHRAHQAVFTDDAIAAAGGAWGITGVSLRHRHVPDSVVAQDGLYAVEFLGEAMPWRVIGAVRGALFAPAQPRETLALLAAPATHIVTLTVTESGYGAEGPDSTVGWLVRGLIERRRARAGPFTVISCDNLVGNGARLSDATLAFAERTDPTLVAWIGDHVAFPSTMVDCMVPASDDAHRARAAVALGVTDLASVQRETFAAWAIEDRFAGPRPAWDRVGVEIVASIADHERLKLHVLNAAHSALAYLGLARGLSFVREAIADPELSTFVENMVIEEVAPALPELAVAPYWRGVRARFANPRLDHRLAQIAEDGPAKIGQRITPVLEANLKAGRPAARLSAVARAAAHYLP